MKKRKVLASDYDGTLRRQGVASQDIAAIEQFRQAGHHFGIVTGRSIMMIVPELAYFNVPYDFIIGNNGGIIVDAQLRCLKQWNIDLTQAFSLIEAFPKENSMLGISNGYEFTTLCNQKTQTDKDYNTIINTRNYTWDEVMTRGCINSFFSRAESPEATQALQKRFGEQFGQAIQFHYNKGTLDASCVNVSKSYGIQWLKEHCYFNDDLTVIGDGENDVQMIQDWHGYAVENGVAAAKQAACCVVPQLSDCIARFMRTQAE